MDQIWNLSFFVKTIKHIAKRLKSVFHLQRDLCLVIDYNYISWKHSEQKDLSIKFIIDHARIVKSFSVYYQYLWNFSFVFNIIWKSLHCDVYSSSRFLFFYYRLCSENIIDQCWFSSLLRSNYTHYNNFLMRNRFKYVFIKFPVKFKVIIINQFKEVSAS